MYSSGFDYSLKNPYGESSAFPQKTARSRVEQRICRPADIRSSNLSVARG